MSRIHLFFIFAVSFIHSAESASLAASRMPPNGLSVDSVPLFVSIGFDDNQSGVDTTLKIFDKYRNPSRDPSSSATYDGTPTRVSYFHTTSYNTFGALTAAWEEAASKGHETGNHTKTHLNGMNFNQQQWRDEIDSAHQHLLSLNGISKLYGFRTPFLAYSDALFSVLRENQYSYTYDCSIGEGDGDDSATGMNLHWPYTLDWGSHADSAVSNHPRLWELPVYVLMVIPDHKLESYSLSAGSSLINKLGSTKITGFDYNLIEKGITGPELSALLKYNLDLRIAGNRAPLLFGAHAANYPNEDHEYSKALSDFLAYATSKPAVRIVPFIDIVRWMENPQGFALNSKPSYRMDISIVPEIIPPDNPCQAEDWNSSKAYTGGDQVVYDGKLWLANWWTQGNAPNTSTAWQYLNDCEQATYLYHGATAPSGTVEVVSGEDFTLQILANSGYTVAKIVVNGEEFPGSSQLLLESIQESKVIKVHFKLDSDWKSHASSNAKTFSVWAQEQGLSGDKTSDADLDGISDYLEYFTGSNPNSYNQAILRPVFSDLSVNAETERYFTIQFEVSTKAQAEYRLEVCNDLTNNSWKAGEEHFIYHSASASTPGRSTIRWRSPLPASNPASLPATYIRLKAREATTQP